MVSAPWVLSNIRLCAGGPLRAVLVQPGGTLQLFENSSSLGTDVEMIDGQGGRLIAGLHDHHLHLFAAAANLCSVNLDPGKPCGNDMLQTAVFSHIQQYRVREGAIRITGYFSDTDVLLDRWQLDDMFPGIAVRVQYSTGSLWVMNSVALNEMLDLTSHLPKGLERDGRGQFTGRLWRGDRWLGQVSRQGGTPDLRLLSNHLSRYGITAVTDTGYTNDLAQLQMLERSVQSTDFPQHASLMCSIEVGKDEGQSTRYGPCKIMLDEARLPDFQQIVRTIRGCNERGRAVAAHCVTETELAFYLAALEQGAAPGFRGNRIEHGALIPEQSLDVIARLGLTVVTQPAFIYERGDRYLSQLASRQIPELYRCGSLMDAGVTVLGSSDAPYGPLNPWLAMATAQSRDTRSGITVAEGECIGADAALALYAGDHGKADGANHVVSGMAASLCLLKPCSDADPLDPVSMTIIDGRIVYRFESP